MKAAFLFAGVAGLGLLQNVRAEDAAKKDLAALQGEWTVASAEKGGKKLTEDERRKLSDYFLTKMVIKDEQITFWISEKGAETKEGSPTPFEIDPARKPKTARCGDLLAIYTLDGDTLKVCLHND